jgi:hypothetical protein
MNEGEWQARSKAGRLLEKRLGIYGGYLNRRRRASRKELIEWIDYYQKQAEQGNYCPKRVSKIITHFQNLLNQMGGD